MKITGTACSAVLARPVDRIEYPVGVVALVEAALLAAEPEGGVALLDRGLAGAGTREALVGIAVARRAVAVGIALIVDGEGVRRGRGQQGQPEGGGGKCFMTASWMVEAARQPEQYGHGTANANSPRPCGRGEQCRQDER